MLEQPAPAQRSEAQRAAARANGAHSRGPRTQEGKARSSRNAWKHGLRATVHLLAPGEDPEEFAALAHGLAREWHDLRPSRALLVERLAAAVWKLRRAERLEAALHALPPRPAAGRLDPEPGLPTALTRLPEYATLVRHQGQLERFLLRALRSLEAPDAAGLAAARAVPGAVEAAGEPGAAADPGAATGSGEDRDPGVDEDRLEDFAPAEDGEHGEDADPEEDEDPVEGRDPGAAAEVEPAALAAAARTCAARLLAQGRVLEAARLTRLCAGAQRCTEARAGPADEPPVQETAEARLARTLAGLTPEERAEWDSLGYENWVVPPGTGRRPMASLTAEWICPADRWRVLEELRRLDDPAEEARVLGHFRRAGLDPGADHPAFAGRVPPAPAAAPSGEDAPPGAQPGAAPPAGRDPAFHALLVRMGLEAEAYHGAGRARRAAEAWRRHARELGVPVPAHAGLSSEEAAAETRTGPPSSEAPADPAAGPAAPAPAAFGPAPAPRPWALAPSSWPWAPEDGLVRADGAGFRAGPA